MHSVMGSMVEVVIPGPTGRPAWCGSRSLCDAEHSDKQGVQACRRI